MAATRDPRVDAYIAKSADFARPILTHIRKVVHSARPDVRETIKWGMPHFEYHGILCAMAAFKAHCTLNFWKGTLVVPPAEQTRSADAMGTFGRITSVADLPTDAALARYVRKAARLNTAGVKAPQFADRKKRPTLRTPPDLSAALRRNAAATAAWKAFSPSHRREYVEWITEAKTAPTRARRLATTVEWVAKGRPRQWKYIRKT